jgi:hypothetical protein
VEKLEGRRQLARPMLIREDIIETGLNEVWWKVLEWVCISVDTDQWRCALVKAVMNLLVPGMVGIS